MIARRLRIKIGKSHRQHEGKIEKWRNEEREIEREREKDRKTGRVRRSAQARMTARKTQTLHAAWFPITSRAALTAFI